MIYLSVGKDPASQAPYKSKRATRGAATKAGAEETHSCALWPRAPGHSLHAKQDMSWSMRDLSVAASIASRLAQTN